MMAGLTPPPSKCHGDAAFCSDSSDVEAGDEMMNLEFLLDLVQDPFISHSSPSEGNREERLGLKEPQGRDGDGWTCGQLDRRWVLWHEFMKEQAHLDAWLQLAEQAVSSLGSAPVSYSTAKEQLKKFETLRCEAGTRLAQLDGLTCRNRILTRLFQGTMQARLLASARGCGQRWDDVGAKLESITGQLQRVVSEWEEFEAEREELALWLADMDARLTEIDHMTGNNCEKLRQLQSFQQSVCENSGRVNALLQRGELLIQRSEASDAHTVERRLLELLRRCSHVYSDIARTHTRLLSMRLVFEDDWILSSDSGCPSETLLEDEDVFEKCVLDLSSVPNRPQMFAFDALDRSEKATAFPPDVGGKPASLLSRRPSPPQAPPPPAPPTCEHLGLEWDPSVDIGRSVSHDDADSSYFSAGTGRCRRDGVKRWSYLSFESRSDISADVTNQEVEQGPEEWLDQDFSSLLVRREGDRWRNLTPVRGEGEPVGFDGGRVKAWLRVQSSSHTESRTSCSKETQTEVERDEDERSISDLHLQGQRRCDDTHLLPVPPSHDLDAKPSGGHRPRLHHPETQPEEEFCCDEDELSVTSRTASSSSALFYLLLVSAFALLAALLWFAAEPPCHRSNRMRRSLHLTLSYVDGPPPI